MLLFLAQDLIQLLIQFETVRILQLHCDSIEYTPTKKEIKSAEEANEETKQFQEIVVAFVSIEEGDDPSVAKKAMDGNFRVNEKSGLQKIAFVPICTSQLKPCISFNGIKYLKTNGITCS